MSPPGRDGAAGVTLTEVLVALALFALIGSAGLSVLDRILGVQAGTEGRLDRLAEVQRAMHLTTRDFLQVEGGTLALDGGVLAFRRPGGDGFDVAVSYGVEDGALVRRISRDGAAAPSRQVLLHDVTALAWGFHADGAGWSETWPPEGAPAGNPAAVALDLTLAGAAPSGRLRRVAVLPAGPAS